MTNASNLRVVDVLNVIDEFERYFTKMRDNNTRNGRDVYSELWQARIDATQSIRRTVCEIAEIDPTN